MRTDATWLLKYLAPLVGGEIVAVGTVRDGNDAPWPKFTVRKSAAPKLLAAMERIVALPSRGCAAAQDIADAAIDEYEEPGTLLEIEVAQDSEGNGAGFLFGLPDPPKETP